MKGIFSALPEIKLTQAFNSPLDNAVATARTCYSSKLIFDEDVRKNEKAVLLRDKIAQSTYLAGHHTTLQHAHFQFAIKNISRQVLWSFFHSHPFYNSEQVSQRYVAVKKDSVLLPDFGHQKLNEVFLHRVQKQHEAYESLCGLLHPICEELYFGVYKGRLKAKSDKRWQGAIAKRAQEVARYVLPLASHSHLYHTISGLTLHRYHRLSQSFDCPFEQNVVIKAMVAEVNRFDADFFKNIEDSLPLEETVEAQIFKAWQLKEIDSKNAARWAQSFDENLKGLKAKLSFLSPDAPKILGDALRHTFCLANDRLSDEEAVRALLSPQKNRYLPEALNLQSLNKASKALDLVQIGFNKKLSHTADSQAQRHRMIPSVKAIFSRTLNFEEPDYIVPKLLENKNAKAALGLYQRIHEESFLDAKFLFENGASAESLQYIFTNAYPIRYQEIGSLMDHMHKWTTRLCYNAQEEIWSVTMEELKEMHEHAPLIAKHILPPCGLRFEAAKSPVCPEGERFCGVVVWKKDFFSYQREF